MTRSVALLIAVLLPVGGAVRAAWTQAVSEEYRIKAAYLYNFAKFVEWPQEAGAGPLTICVAGRNPFGTVLDDLVQDETIGGRPLQTRIILEPEPGCHVVFVPDGAAARAYLRGVTGSGTLTVGEDSTFIEQGGIASFYLERGNVRFEINPAAAERANIRISGRLLQLARLTPPRSASR